MFNLKYKKRLCIPSYYALKDMAKHNVSPFLIEEIVIEGDDYKDKMIREVVDLFI